MRLFIAILIIVAGISASALVLLPSHQKSKSFPVAISYRIQSLGKGYAVLLKNVSDNVIRVKLAALNKTADKVLDPHETWEPSRQDGYTFASGDKLMVSVGDDSTEFTIPDTDKMPILVWYREAFLGKTQVLVVHRNQPTIAAIHIVCQRPSTGEKRIFDNSSWKLSDNYEIGRSDGWGFEPGDIVTITGEGFDKVTSTVE